MGFMNSSTIGYQSAYTINTSRVYGADKYLLVSDPYARNILFS